ncbi:MAG: hypothetical protein ABIR98_10600 [Usitatibacter sp.]
MIEIIWDMHMNPIPATSLAAADLFVVLERAYRQKARNCAACNFSLPFRTGPRDACDANWSVIASSECCDICKLILEELIAKHQARYTLADRLN